MSFSSHVAKLAPTSEPLDSVPPPESQESSRSRHAVSSNLTSGVPPVTRLEVKPWAHFVAGAAGGLTSAALTSPFDVLKTRLQSDYYHSQIIAARAARGTPPPSRLSLPASALLQFRETFQILFSIHKVEGWRALFKGLGPNLVGVVPARAINFSTYGNGKRIISQRFNNGQDAAWVNLCAAVVAGVATGTATNPIWVVKTRLQLDRNKASQAGTQAVKQYRNSYDCIAQIISKEGFQGLYRGLSASYLGVSESTLQWVMYEQMKTYLKRRTETIVAAGRHPTTWDETVDWLGKLGSAGTAKFCAAIVTYPHEVVRTRLRQAPSQNGQLKYTGLVQCFRTVWREEGIASMYGGLTPHLLRVVPSAAIMFGMYEMILRLLGTEA